MSVINSFEMTVERWSEVFVPKWYARNAYVYSHSGHSGGGVYEVTSSTAIRLGWRGKGGDAPAAQVGHGTPSASTYRFQPPRDEIKYTRAPLITCNKPHEKKCPRCPHIGQKRPGPVSRESSLVTGPRQAACGDHASLAEMKYDQQRSRRRGA